MLDERERERMRPRRDVERSWVDGEENKERERGSKKRGKEEIQEVAGW